MLDSPEEEKAQGPEYLKSVHDRRLDSRVPRLVGGGQNEMAQDQKGTFILRARGVTL